MSWASELLANATVKVTGFGAAVVLLVVGLLGATSVTALEPYAPYLVAAAILIALAFVADGLLGGVSD
ncbi:MULTISPECIES: hypothetical protein [Halorussus]|uniref:hypothetical protein n=1 Tax=Halorussus TaxID=1070314 RepID=UPI0020A1F135|nr:hypothetical protein [Halorussus vallis]USZ76371.1 hypothetical protein NGM07_03345 [Halorussus vallis]